MTTLPKCRLTVVADRGAAVNKCAARKRLQRPTAAAEQAAAVGRLRVAGKERAGGRVAFVYDVKVRKEHQRHGHATLAFRALEAEAGAMGLSGIELHVVGQNRVAQAFYAKLGYQPTNITMYKPVGPPAA
ncbi:GNAT family N-acetyltransferase [Caenimonas terrae]|uniref:GNAT family N-acetyltransferase n=1 Tax=Caenimonas terrae TaxID=696074 RepID=A0ABW0NGF8_9BURK